MSDIGAKVTLPEKDISSNNSLDYPFNSSYPNVFTKKVGTGQYTFENASQSPGTVNLLTVAHGITGYVPSYIAYATDNNANYTYLPMWYFSNSALDLSWALDESLTAYCDGTNFKIDFVKTVNSGSPPASAWKDMTGITIKWKYYVFVNPSDE